MIRRHMVEISVLVAIFALVFVALASVAYTKRVDATRRTEQIETCERGNLVRINLNTVVSYLKLNIPYLEVVDCDATIK